METPVETAAHAYFAALAVGDIPAWVDLFADDAVSHDPVGSPHSGKAEIRSFLTEVFKNFRSLALYQREVISNGRDAAVKWEGIAEGLNGQSVVFSGIDVISVNPAGKIQTVYAFWDPVPLLKAVGKA